MKRLWILFLLLLFLSGCAAARATERVIFAMDTQMVLRVYGDGDGAALDALTGLLVRLDKTLSATDPVSPLSALNRDGRTEDPDVLALVRTAQALSAQTGGALDVTLRPVSVLWGFTTDTQAVPDAAALEALRSRTGMDKLTLSDGTLTVPAGTELDLGALAKGYAADLCRAELEARGLSGILSLGGNIQTVGTKPDGTDWVVGIQSPDDPSQNAAVVTVRGARAIVTSGDYQRYFVESGVRYCHIFDPATLQPARSGLRAVTVLADSGLLADGLSTALFVLGLDQGVELWRTRGDFEALWITESGEIWVTPGVDVSGCAFFTVAGG